MSANFNSAYDLCISIYMYYAASTAVFANLHLHFVYYMYTELSTSVKLHGCGGHCLKNTHLLFSSSSTCPNHWMAGRKRDLIRRWMATVADPGIRRGGV